MGLSGNLSLPHKLNGNLSGSNFSLCGNLSNPKNMSGTLSNIILRGFSAYEIAVKHGFIGNEEQWMESIKGQQIQLRINKHNLEWKYENELDDEWKFLITLSDHSENDYMGLNNKPLINSIELIGDLSLDALGVQEKGDYALKEDIPIKMTNKEINDILKLEDYDMPALDEKYISLDGLLFLIQRLKLALSDKVDVKTGYSLMSDTEIIRLASVTNYDDTEVRTKISSLTSKIDALENGTYDDTQIMEMISACRDDISALKEKVTNWDAAYNHSQSAHAPTNAEPNKFDILSVNGTPITPQNKTIDITIPTKTSELLNDSGFVNTYSKTEIDAKLKGGVHARGTIQSYVDLPSDAAEGDMYNIASADAEHGIKAGDNVVLVNGEWDNYGGVIDMSGLVSKKDALTNEEIEQIWTEVMG